MEKLEWSQQRASKEVKGLEYRKKVEGIVLVQPGKEEAAVIQQWPATARRGAPEMQPDTFW